MGVVLRKMKQLQLKYFERILGATLSVILEVTCLSSSNNALSVSGPRVRVLV